MSGSYERPQLVPTSAPIPSAHVSFSQPSGNSPLFSQRTTATPQRPPHDSGAFDMPSGNLAVRGRAAFLHSPMGASVGLPWAASSQLSSPGGGHGGGSWAGVDSVARLTGVRHPSSLSGLSGSDPHPSSHPHTQLSAAALLPSSATLSGSGLTGTGFAGAGLAGAPLVPALDNAEAAAAAATAAAGMVSAMPHTLGTADAYADARTVGPPVPPAAARPSLSASVSAYSASSAVAAVQAPARVAAMTPSAPVAMRSHPAHAYSTAPSHTYAFAADPYAGFASTGTGAGSSTMGHVDTGVGGSTYPSALHQHSTHAAHAHARAHTHPLSAVPPLLAPDAAAAAVAAAAAAGPTPVSAAYGVGGAAGFDYAPPSQPIGGHTAPALVNGTYGHYTHTHAPAHIHGHARPVVSAAFVLESDSDDDGGSSAAIAAGQPAAALLRTAAAGAAAGTGMARPPPARSHSLQHPPAKPAPASRARSGLGAAGIGALTCTGSGAPALHPGSFAVPGQPELLDARCLAYLASLAVPDKTADPVAPALSLPFLTSLTRHTGVLPRPLLFRGGHPTVGNPAATHAARADDHAYTLDAQCEVCANGGDEALLLLCDVCNQAYHTYCINLGRELPPQDLWMCLRCAFDPRYRGALSKLEGQIISLGRLKALARKGSGVTPATLAPASASAAGSSGASGKSATGAKGKGSKSAGSARVASAAVPPRVPMPVSTSASAGSSYHTPVPPLPPTAPALMRPAHVATAAAVVTATAPDSPLCVPAPAAALMPTRTNVALGGATPPYAPDRSLADTHAHVLAHASPAMVASTASAPPSSVAAPSVAAHAAPAPAPADAADASAASLAGPAPENDGDNSEAIYIVSDGDDEGDETFAGTGYAAYVAPGADGFRRLASGAAAAAAAAAAISTLRATSTGGRGRKRPAPTAAATAGGAAPPPPLEEAVTIGAPLTSYAEAAATTDSAAAAAGADTVSPARARRRAAMAADAAMRSALAPSARPGRGGAGDSLAGAEQFRGAGDFTAPAYSYSSSNESCPAYNAEVSTPAPVPQPYLKANPVFTSAREGGRGGRKGGATRGGKAKGGSGSSASVSMGDTEIVIGGPGFNPFASLEKLQLDKAAAGSSGASGAALAAAAGMSQAHASSASMCAGSGASFGVGTASAHASQVVSVGPPPALTPTTQGELVTPASTAPAPFVPGGFTPAPPGEVDDDSVLFIASLAVPPRKLTTAEAVKAEESDRAGYTGPRYHRFLLPSQAAAAVPDAPRWAGVPSVGFSKESLQSEDAPAAAFAALHTARMHAADLASAPRTLKVSGVKTFVPFWALTRVSPSAPLVPASVAGAASTSASMQSGGASAGADAGSDDLDVVAVAYTAGASFAHARHECRLHRFDDASARAQFCDNCHCLICDCPIAYCPAWATGGDGQDPHCQAFRPDKKWDLALKATRQARAALAPKPGFAALPRLEQNRTVLAASKDILAKLQKGGLHAWLQHS